LNVHIQSGLFRAGSVHEARPSATSDGDYGIALLAPRMELNFVIYTERQACCTTFFLSLRQLNC